MAIRDGRVLGRVLGNSTPWDSAWKWRKFQTPTSTTQVSPSLPMALCRPKFAASLVLTGKVSVCAIVAALSFDSTCASVSTKALCNAVGVENFAATVAQTGSHTATATDGALGFVGTGALAGPHTSTATAGAEGFVSTSSVTSTKSTQSGTIYAPEPNVATGSLVGKSSSQTASAVEEFFAYEMNTLPKTTADGLAGQSFWYTGTSTQSHYQAAGDAALGFDSNASSTSARSTQSADAQQEYTASIDLYGQSSTQTASSAPVYDGAFAGVAPNSSTEGEATLSYAATVFHFGTKSQQDSTGIEAFSADVASTDRPTTATGQALFGYFFTGASGHTHDSTSGAATLAFVSTVAVVSEKFQSLILIGNETQAVGWAEFNAGSHLALAGMSFSSSVSEAGRAVTASGLGALVYAASYAGQGRNGSTSAAATLSYEATVLVGIQPAIYAFASMEYTAEGASMSLPLEVYGVGALQYVAYGYGELKRGSYASYSLRYGRVRRVELTVKRADDTVTQVKPSHVPMPAPRLPTVSVILSGVKRIKT